MVQQLGFVTCAVWFLLHLVVSGVECVRLYRVEDEKSDTILENSIQSGKYAHQPQYLAIASKIVRPGQVYRVAMTILSSSHPLRVRASLLREGEEVASAKETMEPGDTRLLLMEVSSSVKEGRYSLRVEGSINGVLGGSGFHNETELEFSPNFLTILIQTNKLVYNHEQPIRIRAVMLTTELKPYSDPVNIYLIDSRGFIMKRWVSVYPHLGFVSVSFVLPRDFPHGWWTVRIVALGQVEEKKILLERWFSHRYDVNVILPAFVLDSEENLEGSIMANHTNVALVQGNATVRAYVRPLKKSKGDDTLQKDLFLQENVVEFYGVYDFSFPMRSLQELAGSTPLDQCEIEVRASVGERFYDIVVTGYARARIVNDTLNLFFLGSQPQIFKPGMTFQLRIAVSYHDFVPLSEERLSTSSLLIESMAIMELGGRRRLLEIEEHVDSTGVLEKSIETPQDAERIEVTARYEDGQGRAQTSITLLAHYSERRRNLQITSSTKLAQAGEFAVFHVRSDFHLKSFNYLVVSKGIILQMGSEKVAGLVKSITTFVVPVSPEMAPSLSVLVYHVTNDGQLVADSMILPVNAVNRVPFTLDVNKKQDRTGNIIELVPILSTEARVGLSGVDLDTVSTQGYNDLTPSSLLEQMYKFEKHHLLRQRVYWQDREGGPSKIQYFSTSNYGTDTNKTFSFSSLVVFTNLNVGSHPRACLQTDGLCRNGDCYPSDRKCDGYKDCSDGSDETGCETADENELLHFFIYRKNRQNSFVDATASDFAWHDVLLGHQNNDFVECEVPKGPSVYRLNAIGISKLHGLVILEDPPLHDSARPFFITIESPEVAIIGEQIGIKVALFNFQRFEIKAEIILAPSDDYRFVQVEAFGVVSSYGPRLTSGEHQHLVYIKPYGQFIVHVPIVATRKGKIEVVITGRTQVAKDVVTIPIEILPDGAPVTVHTSLLLDMRSEAYNIKYLNLTVAEDPIIPLEETYRRYLFGSASARVSVIGDIVGAPLPTEDFVDATDVGHSYSVKSGDQVMFNFAYNLYTLIYLRLTNQLQAPITKKILEYLNRAYVFACVFYKDDAFTMFMKEPSVWLTAYAVRIFHLAQYPDWENNLYVDPEIISKATRYILRKQTPQGSFYETTLHPWNGRMDPRSKSSLDRIQYKNISLTAHVLITLCEVNDLVGDLRIEVASAKKRATAYLETQLPDLNHPYEVAIVTYALMLAGSADAQVGFSKLENSKLSAEGLVYWSPEKIPPPQIVYQNQRPFLQPRLPQKHDAMAVEATAYALMVYLNYGGLYQEHIVKWLNSMRMFDVGFVSTQDTIVAVQALVEYSFRTHIREITNMKLTVESSSNAGNIQTVYVTQKNLAQRTEIEILPNVWGHVEVLSQGSGLSILQLDVSYNVDRDFLMLPSPVPAFDLTIREFYHGRNKSHMNIECCAKWLLTSESPTSGVAVIEILLPTGYDVYRPTMDDYVRSRVVPNLKRARVLPKTAVFMFDYLENEWTCVKFTVERWFPVANLTRYLKAKVYDYYAPEYSQEIIFEDYSLYVLSICEVCGSYQCPYCPYFSTAVALTFNWGMVLLVALLHLFFCKYPS
ncbi:CD109 antigen-like [Centruroides vittatus]|uniref:CD109 antigen-like n=1 Tax=Centruroides vittatus TaxID=120091 RepID=UPI00350EF004